MGKTIFIGISLIFATISARTQEQINLNFDYMASVEKYVTIDTFSNPDNSWQVGSPGKAYLYEARSIPNVIITDTISPYPVNDSSVFTIWQKAFEGFEMPHTATLSGFYKVDTDSINDYGKIEFSPDNGNRWVDLLNDTINPPEWYSEKPVLTGTSDWKYFYVELAHMGFNIELGDTVLYRFTFISDGIDNQKDGLMFDDFWFMDFTEGISQNSTNGFNSNVFPNPSDHIITIEFDFHSVQSVDLDIIDGLGRLMFRKKNLDIGRISIEVNDYTPGLYYYRLYNGAASLSSLGKFIVE